MGKVAYSLGTNHVVRPFRCDKAVELMDVEGRAAIVHETADAVFLRLTFFMVVVMVAAFV